MTARERLIREMTHNHLYMTDERATELVDALLHEEAEKIRAAASGEDLDNSWVVNAYDAASLIDPKVT